MTGLSNSNYTTDRATGRTQDWSIGKVTLTPTLKSVDAKQYDGTTRTTGGVINLATPVNGEQPAVTADHTGLLRIMVRQRLRWKISRS